MDEKKFDALNTLYGFLVFIKKHGPDDIDVGLCGNIKSGFHSIDEMDLYEIVDEWMDNSFMEWPLYSGDVVFPVPDDSFATQRKAFYYHVEHKNLWNKNVQYGMNRYDLLDFLITKLEQELGLNTP